MARRSTGSSLTPTHSLARRLAGFDDDRLVAVLTARPDLAAPRPASFDQLAARASTWPSAQACFDRLDRTHRQLLEALCVLPAPSCAHQLAPFLGPSLEADDLVAPLRRLEDLALVSIDDDHDVWINPAFHELHFPAGLGPPAAAVLDRFPVSYLSDVSRRLGLKVAHNKGAILESLATALSDPKLVRRMVDAGPPGTAALAERLAAGPPTVMANGSYYQVPDRTPVGWLTNRGLLVLPGWGEGCMPGEVGLALRGAVVFPSFSLHRPEPVTTTVDPVRTDTAATEAGLHLVGDLGLILADWEGAPPKVLKTGGVGVRDVRRAAAVTGRCEADAARIIELAGLSGLAAHAENAAIILPTPGFDQWQAADPGRRWAMIVDAWLGAGHHLGAALDAGTGGGTPRPLLPRPSSSAAAQRQAVLDALVRVPPGYAVDPDSWGHAVAWSRPALWEESTEGPAFGAAAVAAVVAEAELLGLCASGSLATAGRLAAGGRLDDAERALSELAPTVVTQFTVQADLTAVAPGALAAAVRAELDLLADVESTGAATVFRFSPSSLVRAFEAGRTSQQIAAWLADHAKNQVPQPLSYLITDLDRRYGRLRVGAAGTYLRCDDPSLTAEVVRARGTASLALRELAPGVLVSPAEPATVMTVLRASGYLPAQEAADATLLICRPPRRRAPGPARPGPISGTAASRRAATPQLGNGAGPPVPRSDRQVPGAGNQIPGSDAQVPGADAQVPAKAARATVAALRRAPIRAANTPTTRRKPTRADRNRSGQNSAQPSLDDFLAAVSAMIGEEYDESDEYEEYVEDDVAPRPTGIVKDRLGIQDLLGVALDQDWVVRVDYTNSKGQDRQQNVAMIELKGSRVQVAVLPRGNYETLAIERIKWARILTEAEEDVLL